MDLNSWMLISLIHLFPAHQSFSDKKARSEGFISITNAYSSKQSSVSFRLYSRLDSKDYELIENTDDFQISSTKYDCTKETKIIIHGWLSSPDYDWVVAMREALLKHLKCNVIVVDWSKGASFLPVRKVLPSAEETAIETATLVKKLQKETCADWRNIHVIGHSIGAHMAGIVGKHIPGAIRRITGLDPAGIFFEYAPPENRLQRSDARFVDVIHTDIATLNLTVDGNESLTISTSVGIQALTGDLDFFPNGGYHQPGCPPPLPALVFKNWGSNETFQNMSEEQMDGFWCHHQKAPAYFTASLGREPKELLAHSCSDYESYLQGKCTRCSPCAVMGILAEELIPKDKTVLRENLKYYLKTSD